MNTTTTTKNQLNGKVPASPSTATGDTIRFEDLVLVVPEESETERSFLEHQLLGHHRFSVLGAEVEGNLDVLFERVSFELEGSAGFRYIAEDEFPECAEGVTGVVDIGGFNTNIGLFSGGDAIEAIPGSRRVTCMGVQKLLEAIASDAEFVDMAKTRGTKTPETPAIHAAIVEETYLVGGGAGRFNFRELFNYHVVDWLNGILDEAQGHWRSLQAFDDLQRIVVVGGGAAIAARLKVASADEDSQTIPILFPEAPQIANARGCLYLPDYSPSSTLVVDAGNHFLKVASRWGNIVLPSRSGKPTKSRKINRRGFRATPYAYYVELLEGKVREQYPGRNPGWVFGKGVEQHSEDTRAAFKNARGKHTVIPRLAIFAAFLTHLKQSQP